MPPPPTTTVGRSPTRARWIALGIQLALAVALLLVAAVGARSAVRTSVRQGVQEQLRTLLRADVAALEIWLQDQQDLARAAAALVGGDGAAAAILHGPVGAPGQLRFELEWELGSVLTASSVAGYALVDPDGVVRALRSAGTRTVGDPLGPMERPLLKRALVGEVGVSRPIAGPDGRAEMLAYGPVSDGKGEVLGALFLGLNPNEGFSRILSVARSGRTGETFAFDRDGLLLSQSRFRDDLRRLGLIQDEFDDVILNVALREPGDGPPETWSPTRLARQAAGGGSGVDVDPYPSYRGTPVVGAWTWLPAHDFGVATEVDAHEAYGSLAALTRVHAALAGLVLVAVLIAAAGLLGLGRLQQRRLAAEPPSRELGAYSLGRLIGKGGMGEVFEADHRHLRRRTAVKILRAPRGDPNAVARFEREVQLCAQLTHPNTIAIYDYGATEDGDLYYVMEYVEGLDLVELVQEHGPLPDARAAWLLAQAAGSLHEAHQRGLVHRDVKAGNLMVCQRGGEADVVKVLDFGLARTVESGRTQLTTENTILGTPTYMAPELFDEGDKAGPATDIYALGVTGYFLLAGGVPFGSDTLASLVIQHARKAVPPLSQAAGRPVAPELERLILACLAKDPAERPTAARLRDGLLPLALPWRTQAAAWWAGRATLHPSPEPP